MSSIVVCYKWVIDEADIVINPDLSVNTQKADGKISDYDKNAIEAGVQLAANSQGKIYGLTFGTASSKSSLKDALSRGLDEAIWVNGSEAEGADGMVTAKALAEGVKSIEDLGVIICGEGSSDQFARQIPSRLGAYLDLPVITSVFAMRIENGCLIATRRLESEEEIVSVKLPAVVSVLPDINPAPVPGLKNVLAAGKKPVKNIPASSLTIDFESKSKKLSVKGYVMKRKNIIFEGDTKEAVADLVSALKKEGVL